jgi:hypothetical protein
MSKETIGDIRNEKDQNKKNASQDGLINDFIKNIYKQDITKDKIENPEIRNKLDKAFSTIINSNMEPKDITDQGSLFNKVYQTLIGIRRVLTGQSFNRINDHYANIAPNDIINKLKNTRTPIENGNLAVNTTVANLDISKKRWLYGTLGTFWLILSI